MVHFHGILVKNLKVGLSTYYMLDYIRYYSISQGIVIYLFLSPLDAQIAFPFPCGQRFLVHHAKDVCGVVVRPYPFLAVRRNVLDLQENVHREKDDLGGDLIMTKDNEVRNLVQVNNFIVEIFL